MLSKLTSYTCQTPYIVEFVQSFLFIPKTDIDESGILSQNPYDP